MLTGQISSGKTSFGRELAEHGFHVIDADGLSRQVYAEKGDAFRRIVYAFKLLKLDVLDKKGNIDTERLGSLVFNNSFYMKTLTDITFPLGRELIAKEIQSAEKKGKKLIIIDIAFGFEVGIDKFCDEVWFIDTPFNIALPAYLARGAFATEAKFRLIRSSQMSRREHLQKADWVFFNDREVDAVSEWANAMARLYKDYL